MLTLIKNLVLTMCLFHIAQYVDFSMVTEDQDPTIIQLKTTAMVRAYTVKMKYQDNSNLEFKGNRSPAIVSNN